LYLDGERLALSRELKLTKAQQWIAGIAAAGVLLSGIGAVLDAVLK
jgi:hypothetical protein